MLIDQKTLAELVKLGGQYFLPIAALLRALYAGVRGKLPEGFTQIGVASVFTGLAALVGTEQLSVQKVIVDVLSNSVFMAGLLSFIVAYLLRMRNRGLTVDAVVGGVVALIAWVIWVRIIPDNHWDWWTVFPTIAAGAAAFVTLRILLRQIARLVRLTTYFISIAIVLMIGAGAIMLLQTLLTRLSTQ